MYSLRPGWSLILASASPRRQELLARVGLEFSLAPAQVNEDLQPSEAAEQAAQRLAQAKAQAAPSPELNTAVLAADTLVALGETVLGKPTDLAQARAMLQALSGQEHRVVTGFCLLSAGQAHSGLAVSRVRFRRLRPEEIEAYLASGEPMGKAGAYAVQGLGAALVEAVSGSYTNVVGLPLAAVLELLMQQGVVQPRGDGA